MSIQQPWPLADADYANPQPFDQRGCCWPWGTTGPRQKLPMRWAVELKRQDGTLPDFTWFYLFFGGLFVTDVEADQTPLNSRLMTKWTLNGRNYLQFARGPEADDPWICQGSFQNDGADTTGGDWIEPLDPDWNYTDGLTLPLNVLGGAAPTCDIVVLTPLHWYEDASPWTYAHH